MSGLELASCACENKPKSNDDFKLNFNDEDREKMIEETLSYIENMALSSKLQPRDPIMDRIEKLSKNAESTKSFSFLHVAVRDKSLKTVELLLECNLQLDARMEGGKTPLMIASLHKRQEIVELLIEKGADVNAKCNNGKTPLHYASSIGDIGIVRALLKNGARVDG